jgi:putative sterol carrier protein
VTKRKEAEPMVEELLRGAIDKFNRTVAEDPKVKEEVADKVRTVNVVLDAGKSYHFVLDHGHIDGLLQGPAEAADITITSTEEVLRKVLSGEMSAMKAYALRKLQLKASIDDLLTIRKLL